MCVKVLLGEMVDVLASSSISVAINKDLPRLLGTSQYRQWGEQCDLRVTVTRARFSHA
jgi:hypothetical protein